jgi:Tol biopolymer transport system component
MTKTEQQLRDALTAVADLVQPREQSQRASEHPKRRHSPWLGPVCVAAAIVLIVTVGSAVSQRLPGERPTSGSATTAAAMQPVAPTGPARFFAVLQMTVVKVYNAKTGAPTQTVPNPPDVNVWTTVSATRDDRLFLLSGYIGIGASSNNLTDNPRLYWLRLDASGKMSSLIRVSGFHSTQHLLAMAVSPDGTRVAYALPIVVKPDSNGDSQSGIAVLNLATRHTQTFPSDGDIRNLSWANDGRHLAFFAGGAHGHDGIWTLDTQARPSKNLYAASRLVIRWEAGPLGTLTTPVLSADGSKIYAIATQTELPTGGPNWTRLIEIDAATGRQLRVLYQQKYTGVGADNNAIWQFTRLARDTGSERLLIISTGYAYRIDIKTTHTARTPIGPTANDLAW